MFKRASLFILGIAAAVILTLIFAWRELPAQELYSDSPVITAQRITQDLSGKWNSYSSLRQAWLQETQFGSNPQKNGLTGGDSIVLPSDQSFRVVAKKFKVSGIWSFKTAQLVLDGVYGKAKVFLNGIEEINYLGEIEGLGGTYTIDIQPTRLDYGQENILYIHLSSDSIHQKKLFGWLLPAQNKIIGQIQLQAVPESTVDVAKTSVSYDQEKKQAIVSIWLKHHLTLDYAPWALSAEIREQDRVVAECLVPLNSDGNFEQQVDLIFDLPDVKFWSPAAPFLYNLRIVLTNERGDHDSIQLPIGFSNIISPPDSWVINGKPFKVNGEILTWQQETLIRNQQQIENYLQNLKSKGINVLYFLNFFPNEAWLYAADKHGIGVWLELPVAFMPAGTDLYCQELEDLLRIAGRHPCVLAWTVAKGLEPSREAANYLNQIEAQLNGLPAYNLSYFSAGAKGSGLGELIIYRDSLQGEWGNLVLSDAFLGSADSEKSVDQKMLIIAICWLIWLMLVSIQNLRSFGWNYKELFNPNPKRRIRRAFTWSLLALISRKITMASYLIYLLYLLPERYFIWLPYNFSFWTELKHQSPFILGLFLTVVLILLRLFSVGMAAQSFSKRPGTLGLCCWLERRYIWFFLFGIASLAVLKFSLPWYVPLLLYVLMSIILFPVRVRDVRRAGGKYLWFARIPFTVLIILSVTIVIHFKDFHYLLKLVLPEIRFTLPEDLTSWFKNLIARLKA